jgi:hypothetical protein
MAFGITAGASVIDHVTVDRGTFNPTANDVVTISATFAKAGTASILVIDRDGYAIRRLTSRVAVRGPFSVSWNGRDDNGAVVADEAYSFRIEWTDGNHGETYFPAAAAREMITIPPRYYDRRGGTLAYTLPAASRVHLQAGTVWPGAKRNSAQGVVMKTIVNRAPRAQGAIAEPWNGFDESGSVFLPDVANFVVAIAATPLPDGAVIAFGNRTTTFVDTALTRHGTSFLTGTSAASHAHHASLDALDDFSPNLSLEVVNGRWSSRERLWIVSGSAVQLRATVTGPTAERFLRQPATLYGYVNSTFVKKSSPANHATLNVPASKLHRGTNIVTVNWSSSYGPIAANSVRVRLEQQSSSAGAAGKR